jgi:uncharacterized membrane protein
MRLEKKTMQTKLFPAVAIPLTFALALFMSACLEFKVDKVQKQLALQASFASLKQNVFTPKCASCHVGANAPHGIDLTSYQNIVNSPIFPPLVVAGNPEGSSLFQSCSSGKMPKNSAHLTSTEMKALYDWIKNGAKEDDNETPGPVPSAHPTEPGGEPAEHSAKEPCDPTQIGNEPGLVKCSSEPTDD